MVTLVGLAVAVFLVRRQLRSDVLLRQADRRARATDPLADALIEAGKNLSIFTIRGDDPFWSATDWPGWFPVITAYNEAARLVRPEGDLEEVLHAALCTHSLWERSQAFKAEKPMSKRGARLAHVDMMSDFAKELSTMGVTLRQWDGLLPVPFSNAEPYRDIRDRTAEAAEHKYGELVTRHSDKPQASEPQGGPST